MSKKVFAGIDIGTNTILMMLTEKSDGQDDLKIIKDFHSIARLGEGVDKTGIINNEAIARASKILKSYKDYCKQFSVSEIYAVGTSALRDATNAGEVRDLLGKIIGTEIRIISGEEEAKLSFIGTAEDEAQSIVIDIGGGSTEIISGASDKIDFRKSLQIGAVRVTEKFFPSHPPTESELENAIEFINNNLSAIPGNLNFEKIYAVAGTPTTLATVLLGLNDYDTAKVNGFELFDYQLDKLIAEFLSVGLDKIVSDMKIHPKRADVILAGTLILKSILNYFKSESCFVSAYGLRYGILKHFTGLNNAI